MIVLTEEKPKVGSKYIEARRARFGSSILDESWQAPDQVTVTVPVNSLPDVVEMLYYQQGGWLATVVANDERPLNGQFAIYYVLSVEGADESESNEKAYVVVRAQMAPPHQPEFPSVTPKVPAAIWYEREVISGALREITLSRGVGISDLADSGLAIIRMLRSFADYK